MLQQTQAARVAPAFERFMARFPTIAALATASRADVVRAWAGLGYNRRAVALSEAARAIVREHGSVIPADPVVLERLPGVGPYTAGAVASLAFGAPVVAMDTNVRRVVARSELGVNPTEADRREIAAAARRALDRRDPGGWNQALMDVGREHCRPAPRCDSCPLARRCRFRTRAASSPVRARRPPFEGSSRQVRGAVVAVLRERSSVSLGDVIDATGFQPEAVVRAVEALAADGLVRAGPGALAGSPRGRVSLVD